MVLGAFSPHSNSGKVCCEQGKHYTIPRTWGTPGSGLETCVLKYNFVHPWYCHIYANDKGYISIPSYVAERLRSPALKLIDDKSTVSQAASKRHAITSRHRDEDDDEDTDPNPHVKTRFHSFLLSSHSLCHTLTLQISLCILPRISHSNSSGFVYCWLIRPFHFDPSRDKSNLKSISQSSTNTVPVHNTANGVSCMLSHVLLWLSCSLLEGNGTSHDSLAG